MIKNENLKNDVYFDEKNENLKNDIPLTKESSDKINDVDELCEKNKIITYIAREW